MFIVVRGYNLDQHTCDTIEDMTFELIGLKCKLTQNGVYFQRSTPTNVQSIRTVRVTEHSYVKVEKPGVLKVLRIETGTCGSVTAPDTVQVYVDEHICPKTPLTYSLSDIPLNSNLSRLMVLVIINIKIKHNMSENGYDLDRKNLTNLSQHKLCIYSHYHSMILKYS